MTRYVLTIVVAAAVGLLFALGVKAAFPAAPSPAPATAPVPPTVAPSVCERALAANLTVAYRALVDYQHGRARAGRGLWLSETAALPVGCGR